jgi:Grx4 family monothiol glutaredoxin
MVAENTSQYSRALTEIGQLVESHPVVLFMKGSPAMPQCGFSASVVEILDQHLSQYRAVDVLSDETVRSAVKEFSDWPTIPQLYIGGTFVGGADIIQQMHESDELKSTLTLAIAAGRPGQDEAAGEATSTLNMSITSRAVAAALESKSDDDGPYLRVSITSDFEHNLVFDNQKVDDVLIEQEGLSLLFDTESSMRAAGMEIDFVEEDDKSGFKITNPNGGREPEASKEQTATPAAFPQLPPPSVIVEDAAYEQFVGAVREEGEGRFGVRVKANRMGEKQCVYELDIVSAEDKKENDFEVIQKELVMWISPHDGKNLDGVIIDYVETDAGAGFKFKNPKIEEGWADDRAHAFQNLLDSELNPSIAAHGGYIELLDIFGNTAFVKMGGGCQGCGMAEATLEQGIKDRMQQAIPSLQNIVDITDHGAGENPYYQP